MFEPLTQVVFLEPVLNSHHLVLNVSKIETTRNICIYTELRQKICLDQPELINLFSRGVSVLMPMSKSRTFWERSRAKVTVASWTSISCGT